MRSQWCRENIDLTVEKCGLSEETRRECKAGALLCDENPEISDFATSALRPLIREKDTVVRENAISSVKKALEQRKNPITGRFLDDNRLTATEVRGIIAKTRSEMCPPAPPANVGKRVVELQRQILEYERKIELRQEEIAMLLGRPGTSNETTPPPSNKPKPEPKSEPDTPEGKPKDDDDKIPPKPKHEGKISIVGVKSAPLRAGRLLEIKEPITEIIDGEYTYLDEPAPTANPPGVPE